MNDTLIEISTCGKPQGGYVVSINTRSHKQLSDSRIVMTKEELKEFRDMLHSALIELNSELIQGVNRMNETNEKQNDLRELLDHIERLINATDTAIVLLSFIQHHHGVVLQDPHDSLVNSFDALIDARREVNEAFISGSTKKNTRER